MNYFSRFGSLIIAMLFGLIACVDPEITNPNDPNYELSPPSDLTAESLSDSSIILRWHDNEKNELGFTIERESGDGFVEIMTVPADVTEYIDSGLMYGHNYTYRVAVFMSRDTSVFSEPTTVITDLVDYDGNLYKVIQVGDQVWLAENLKVTHYRYGTSIDHLTADEDWISTLNGAYCYHENNISNGAIYGALYNWYVVNGDSDGDYIKDKEIAPEGWHVPRDVEWKELEIYLGMNQSELDIRDFRGTNEGSKLAGNNGLWNNGKLENDAGFNSSSFNALPGGFRSTSGNYYNIGHYASFWSTTPHGSSGAWNRFLYSDHTEVLRSSNGKTAGYSIRLLRD
jgi:uncharacterized protein (TIGR02145 family)